MSSTFSYDTITPMEIGGLGQESVVGGLFAGFDYRLRPDIVLGFETGLQVFNGEASISALTYADDYEFAASARPMQASALAWKLPRRLWPIARFPYAAIHAQTSTVTSAPQEDYLSGYQVAAGIETEVMRDAHSSGPRALPIRRP